MISIKSPCNNCKLRLHFPCTGPCKKWYEWYQNALEKLMDYEFAEEDGRLYIMPQGTKGDINLIKHGHWKLLSECANEGIYCSVCNKKVYKKEYANQKIKSKYYPNCGAIMDEYFEVL